MIERFSETALREAREYYKEHGIRSSFSDAIKEKICKILDNGIDFECFMLFISNMAVWNPNIRKFFDELYKTDKIRFYTNARNHKLYSSHYFTDKNLSMEVSMRRAFGILINCFEDEELLNKIIKCIEKEYLWIKTLSKKFDRAEFEKKVLSMADSRNTSIMSPQDGSLEIILFYFVLFAKYGYATRKSDVWWLYSHIKLDIQAEKIDFVNEEVLDVNDYDTSKLITKQFKKLQNALITGSDFARLAAIVDCEIENDLTYNLDEKVSKIRTLLENACEGYYYELALSRVALFEDVLLLNGLELKELLWEYKTDSLERDRLVKLVSIARKKISTFSEYYIENEIINTEDYIVALCFDFLSKAIQHSRDFYFKNNSETEYYEIQKYQEKTADMKLEIEKFNSALSAKDKEIEFLKRQIEDLKNAENKETKEIVKPYNEEISFLKKQIEDLKEKLSSEQKKTDELNKLRTFAFSVQSEDVLEEKDVSLSELLKDKKITIVGGHINWRNKMKTKYPKLNLLDGHSTSFDLQTLTTSDVVLLHTGNMSHAVYYKMIDNLRTSNVKFDYIGRYNNANLLEQEIAEILK